ncbi:hypothetical protein [Streptomyces pactum]|uniref:Uncharacterized protein n=1 Tax=Streptomyces pactum TaxID=68249 RepID=A0A1S6J259_9ACTN|nr:hypothetical protein [Streptomyces pactum]AQS65845.1 hypothetical protein B1H29_01835 [Streptomyces pactum]
MQSCAATDPSARSGGSIGTDALAQPRGGPTRARLSPAAADAETGRRLWDLSERLTGRRFPLRPVPG